MCKAMEDMRNEAAREAERMKAIRMARLMIEDGKLSYEDIALGSDPNATPRGKHLFF